MPLNFQFTCASSDDNSSVREGLRSPIIAFGKEHGPISTTAEEWHRIEMFVVQAALMPIGGEWRGRGSGVRRRADDRPPGMTFSLMSIRLYGITDEEPEASWSWPSWTTWSKTETFPGDSDAPYPPDVERHISRSRDRAFSDERERRRSSAAGELPYTGRAEGRRSGDCERTLSGNYARALSLERAHTHGSSQSTLQRTSQIIMTRTLQSTLPDAVVQK